MPRTWTSNKFPHGRISSSRRSIVVRWHKVLIRLASKEKIVGPFDVSVGSFDFLLIFFFFFVMRKKQKKKRIKFLVCLVNATQFQFKLHYNQYLMLRIQQWCRKMGYPSEKKSPTLKFISEMSHRRKWWGWKITTTNKYCSWMSILCLPMWDMIRILSEICKIRELRPIM